MARIRSVHPDLCSSETMAALPADVERTFVRLWTHCDDEGRCIDNLRLIKAALFPLHDEVTIDVLDCHLSTLEGSGLLVRYVADGKAVIQVSSWTEFQHPQKPSKSKLPALPDDYRNGTRTVNPQGEERSRTPIVGSGVEREVGEGVGEPPVVEHDDGAGVVASEVRAVFDAWVESTGKHRAKLDDKRRKLIRARLRDYPVSDLVDAVRGWSKSPHHRGQNDRRTVYNDLELLLRDAAHVERFRDLERNGARFDESRPQETYC